MSKKDTYREVKFWGDIDEAVKMLQTHHQQGEKVFIDFNGHLLYSDTVTTDSAYLVILGKTKTEFDKEQEEWHKNCRKAEEEYKAKIPDLAKEWVDKGHAILDEKYWEEWDNCVPVQPGDLYRARARDACLDIVKSLNDGCTMGEAKEIIENQNHSNMSFSLVCAMVYVFCDRGKEFAEFVR